MSEEPGIACQTCERGVLVRKNIHRLSGPAVVIGYIFLIPSILGVAISLLCLAVVVFAAPLGYSVNIKGLLVTVAFIAGIPSLFAGLLGWLLVMKKHVLRCTVCGATVNAS